MRTSSTVESAGRLPRGNALAAMALTLHLVLPVTLVAAGTIALGVDAVREDRDTRPAIPSPMAAGASLVGHLVYGIVLGIFYAAGYPG